MQMLPGPIWRGTQTWLVHVCVYLWHIWAHIPISVQSCGWWWGEKEITNKRKIRINCLRFHSHVASFFLLFIPLYPSAFPLIRLCLCVCPFGPFSAVVVACRLRLSQKATINPHKTHGKRLAHSSTQEERERGRGRIGSEQERDGGSRPASGYEWSWSQAAALLLTMFEVVFLSLSFRDFSAFLLLYFLLYI